MGEPPCAYAFIGLGSLARNEMSPYSDLEFALLIQENSLENLTYFRNLIRWLEIQVIHLGETEIKILHHGLASPVFRGFSFDEGGNTPLGKRDYIELIKKPDAMASLQSERFYQEDLILSNVLKTASMITGEPSLYFSYLQSLQKILSQKPENRPLTIGQQRALHLITGHLTEFEPDVGYEKEESPLFNIKAELYRLPSFLIAGLADYFEIGEQNSWDRLEALLKRNILSKEGVQNLREALTKIMYLRICCHLHYGRECDEAYHPAMQKKGFSKESIQGAFILSDKAMEEIISIYRVIFPLHRLFKEVSKTGNFKPLSEATFYDDSLLAQAQAYTRLSQYQAARQCYQQACALNPDDLNTKVLFSELLISLAEYSEAKRYVQKVLNDTELKDEGLISRALNLRGMLNNQSGDSKTAIDNYAKSLELSKKRYGEEHLSVALGLNNLSAAWKNLGNAKKALEYSKEALKIAEKCQGAAYPSLMKIFNNIGMAWKDLGKLKVAIKYFEKALHIAQKIYKVDHPIVALILNNLGAAWHVLKNPKKVMAYCEEALLISKRIFGTDHPHVANSLMNIGLAKQFLREKKCHTLF